MHILVLMSGGFHPFHPGHLSLYQSAKKAFPNADVVVGATNVQKDRPFSFKDKATLARIAGVPKDNFVEVKRQFAVKDEPNIESRIKDPDNTVLILVRSIKDKNEQPQPWKLNPDGSVPMSKKGQPLSNYLLPYEGNQNNLQPLTKHAYMAYLPVKQFTGDMKSATEIRGLWPKLSDENKKQLAMQLYPATQTSEKLLANVIDILNRNLGTANIQEVLTQIRSLIKEAPEEKKIKLYNLLKEYSDKINSSNVDEGIVLGPNDLVDIYVKGKTAKGNSMTAKIGQRIPNKQIPKYVEFISQKYRINPNAIFYGPSKLSTKIAESNLTEDYLEEK